MKSGPSTTLATLAEIMRAEGSATEIQTRLGNKSKNQILVQIRAMQKHGLVYIIRWNRNRVGSPSPVWAAQTTPFEFHDAVRPPKVPARDAVRRERQEGPFTTRDAAHGVTRHYVGV